MPHIPDRKLDPVVLTHNEAKALHAWLDNFLKLGLKADVVIKRSAVAGLGTATWVHASQAEAYSESKNITDYDSW